MASMARILAISSQVVRGGVGLSATVPALQAFGHEVWALPTVLLSHRPGLGRIEKLLPPPDALTAMLAALEAEGCFARIDAVLTGYFPSAEAVRVAAAAIRRIKAARPDALYLCDPVLGDGGRLYVPEPVAVAIRDELLPLADIATPNHFELQWLGGLVVGDTGDLLAAARTLGPRLVAVTSAIETPAQLTTLVADGEQSGAIQCARVPSVPNGTGDAFAGLLLGALLEGASGVAAVERAIAMLDALITRSRGRDVLAPAVSLSPPSP